MTVLRTQSRVDNELIYDRNKLTQTQFLGTITEATTVRLAVGNTVVEGATDAAILTIHLPDVSAAKGQLYSIVYENANAGEVHVVPTGLNVGTAEFADDGAATALFYSDGRWWHYLSPGNVVMNQHLVGNQACSGMTTMSGSVDIHHFITITAGEAHTPAEAGQAVDGVCYYKADGGGLQPGLFHPLGCQALVLMASTASFVAGEYVYTDTQGRAVNIGMLPIGTDYQPIGYAVNQLDADQDRGDTHLEVFLFPGDMLGVGNLIEPVAGEGMM